MRAPTSNRTDRRGHWPRGKRRAEAALPAALRRRLDRALERQEYSRRGIARVLKVSDRSVRRWLAGEDWPLAANIEALERLLGRH